MAACHGFRFQTIAFAVLVINVKFLGFVLAGRKSRSDAVTCFLLSWLF